MNEHFSQCEEDFEAGRTDSLERVARDVGVSSLRNVVLVEVLLEKYAALKQQAVDLKKEVATWKDKVASLEGELTLAGENKKMA